MNREKMNAPDIAYSILEIRYIKMRGREVSINPRDNRDLYPCDWFINNDIRKKSEILAEAIKKNCLIVETEGYADIQEGVRRPKKDEKER